MQALDEKYYSQLTEIAGAIQASPVLAQYLEEEEDELYTALRNEFEPHISQLHHVVAAEAPLQLVTFEKYLLDPLFEGLYLPRVMGYAVLRMEINEQHRYVRPNDHFKDILLAICKSPHFEQLKKRIGQCISTGFALSSDIWITNLLGLIENKRIRNFLQSLKHDQFYDPRFRADTYNRYANQFKKELYYSADFPATAGEMHANWSALRQFLLKRFEKGGDNSSLAPKIKAFVDNTEFGNSWEYMEMLCIYGNFIEMDAAEKKSFSAHFERERKGFQEFDEKFLRFQLTLEKAQLTDATTDQRMSALVDKKVLDKISDFYRIADKVHSEGYVDPNVIEAVREFTETHQGVSIENECLRQLVFNYFDHLLQGLTDADYAYYFEITKVFNVYMKIFDNQLFNQSVEKISLKYVGTLLKKFTDKRAKDYQDVKRFVATQFVDMAFLTDKEVVELFKTRRKRRKKSEMGE